MFLVHDARLPGAYIKTIMEEFPDTELIPFPGPSGGAGPYGSIRCHPDIYHFRTGPASMVVSPSLPRTYTGILAEKGVKCARGVLPPGEKYPSTALYNVLTAGDTVFHNLEYTDRAVINEVTGAGLNLVDVPQGYAACSSLVTGADALVTSDRVIAEKARDKGFRTLLIRPGHIVLPGETSGFIGGAGGRAPDGRIVMLGDLDTHPDGDEIRRFASLERVRLVELAGLPVFDAGGLFFFS